MPAPQAPTSSPLLAPASSDAASTPMPPELVGRSAALRRARTLIERVALTNAPLLVRGETGTGRGAAALRLHQRSARAHGPCVVLDCASVGSDFLAGELFGLEEGDAPSAPGPRAGALERAHRGTLFLDGLETLPAELQARLAEVLEARTLTRVRGSTPVRFDVRLVASARQRLWPRVRQGLFREDLFFRLSVFTVELPPLRERPEDVPLLVDALAGAPLWTRLSEEARARLLGHSWPGNVRELRTAVERARLLDGEPGALEGWLPAADAPGGAEDALPVDLAGPFKASKDALLRRFEHEYLTRLLARTGGNVARAARAAGLDRKHLYSLLHKHGLVQGEGD